MAIKNINMAKVFSSANTKQSLRLVCDYIDADELEVNPENEIIYANLDGEVKEFKNPTIEIVEKAIRLALPRIS